MIKRISARKTEYLTYDNDGTYSHVTSDVGWLNHLWRRMTMGDDKAVQVVEKITKDRANEIATSWGKVL